MARGEARSGRGARLGMRVLPWLLVVCVMLAGCTVAAPAAAPTPAPPTVLRLSGSGTALPLVQRLAEDYQRLAPQTRFQFDSGTNSGGAIAGVLSDQLDLAVVNRPLNEREQAESVSYWPFARDALVFAVNLPNPIDNLSTAQLQAIYGGTITTWQELGAAPAAILVLDRDEDESARRFGLLPLMDGQPVAARTTVLSSAGGMLAALSDTSGALGYTSLGLVRLRQPARVKVLSLDQVPPTPETVTEGQYRWSLTLAVVARTSVPPAALQFIDFLRGDAARTVIRDLEYAPVQS